MQLSFGERLKHAWNVFKSRDPTYYSRNYVGGLSEWRPDINRRYYRDSGDRSIVTAIKNRIAVDAAQVELQHVKIDDNGRFVELIDSGLNRCLSLSANVDQTGRALRLDIFMSMLDEGVIAIVPVDTTFDPEVTGTYQIKTIRIGKVVQWYPKHVIVQLYDENTGRRQEIAVPKTVAAIVENPFYAVMNAPNSTFQRLIHKLALLDSVDEQSSSGKLDLIVQLPYTVKTETRRQQADQRRRDIVNQLEGSKFGIAYMDAAEKIVQLNRPLENNLLAQIQYLTDLAFDQLGITKDILNGTADEKTMLNYNNRIIEPLVAAVADSMKRTFLTQTAITQKQSIEYYRDPFALVPVNNMADIADKFTRNEIMTSNEIRQVIGMKPSDDPNADVLRNKNLYDTTGPMPGTNETIIEENTPLTEEDADQALADLDDLDAQLDELEASLEQSDEDGDILEHNYDPVYRHEYYEKYEKKGLKVGDEGGASTKGLNELGRDYAKYVRQILSEQRKSKVAGSKSSMDSKIAESKSATDAGVASSKERRDKFVTAFNTARDKRLESERNATNAGIEQSKSQRDKKIASTNEARDKRIEAERNATNADIESSKNARDSLITQTNEQRDREIESARARTKADVESHKNTMQTKIEVLQSTLSSMSKSDRSAAKDRIRQEIASLREENAKQREALQEAFKSESNEIRTKAKTATDTARQEHSSNAASARNKLKETTAGVRTAAKAEADSARKEHRSASTEARNKLKETNKAVREKTKQSTDEIKEEHSSTTAKLRQNHKDATAILREAHKKYTEQAKQEYKDEYAKELEWIKAQPKYQAATKKKGSSKSSNTSHSVVGTDANGRKIVRRN
jgi:hypothetical protein